MSVKLSVKAFYYLSLSLTVLTFPALAEPFGNNAASYGGINLSATNDTPIQPAAEMGQAFTSNSPLTAAQISQPQPPFTGSEDAAPLDGHGRSFAGEDLTGLDFHGQTLNGADFSNAKLISCDFRGAKLAGANFSNSDLSQADFSDANMMKANLANANMTGANFSGANMYQADLTGADLSEAIMSGTNLNRAITKNVDLTAVRQHHSPEINVPFNSSKEMPDDYNNNLNFVSSLGKEPLLEASAQAADIMKALTTTTTPGEPARVNLPIEFKAGSDTLTEDGKKMLDEIATALASLTLAGTHIRIEGHTDASGNKEQNKNLSFRRAMAVMRFLVKECAISADKLTVKGFGDTKPLVANNTPENRAKNRRVTLVNLGK